MDSVIAGPLQGCSCTFGVAAIGEMISGRDEPGGGSRLPGNPGHRMGDMDHVAIESIRLAFWVGGQPDAEQASSKRYLALIRYTNFVSLLPPSSYLAAVA